MIIASLQVFHLFSPLHKTVPSNMLMLAMNVNPYNIEFVWSSQYFSEMITNSGTMIDQVAALVLLRKQSNKTLGSKILKRGRGSLKILLTNPPSFLIILRSTMEAPIRLEHLFSPQNVTNFSFYTESSYLH